MRVHTTKNHIAIYFLPQYQRQRKWFFSERELKLKGIAWHIDSSSLVETLIYHGKLANQIARLAAIVVKITFYKENEWACDGDSDNTFHTWLQLSSVCINSLPTKYRLYLLKLISIFGHFLTVNNRPYGRCYVKEIIPLFSFLWISHLCRGKFSKIVSKCFLQVFKGFKCYVFKNIVFLIVIFQPIEPP